MILVSGGFLEHDTTAENDRYAGPKSLRLQSNIELVPIRETLLDIEAILSCAAAQLSIDPMEIAAAKQSIEEARTMLLDLAEAVEKIERN